jgi:DNA-directed RNA polymerase specialized sigma24 family protein
VHLYGPLVHKWCRRSNLKDDDEEEAGEDHALLVQRVVDLIQPEFSEQNWKAFLRVAIEGCSAVEVAESINVNAQVVRQANYRIRGRLRLVLQDLIE